MCKPFRSEISGAAPTPPRPIPDSLQVCGYLLVFSPPPAPLFLLEQLWSLWVSVFIGAQVGAHLMVSSLLPASWTEQLLSHFSLCLYLFQLSTCSALATGSYTPQAACPPVPLNLMLCCCIMLLLLALPLLGRCSTSPLPGLLQPFDPCLPRTVLQGLHRVTALLLGSGHAWDKVGTW